MKKALFFIVCLCFAINMMAQTKTITGVVVDATDQVLGRLCAKVAKLLRGKYKPCYTPFVECGDNVIIINADKVKLTGNKWTDREYLNYTGYPGGLKMTKYRELLNKKPEFAVYEAIRRMMPKGPLGRQMLTKVRIYRGAEHKHEAQKPEVLVLK